MERAEEGTSKRRRDHFSRRCFRARSVEERIRPQQLPDRKRRPLPSSRSRAVIEIRKKHISLADYKLHGEQRLPFLLSGRYNFRELYQFALSGFSVLRAMLSRLIDKR